MIRTCFTTLLILITFCCKAQQATVTHLLCENRENPVGVDINNPSLSWQIAATYKDYIQKEVSIQFSDDSTFSSSSFINNKQSTPSLFLHKKLLPAHTYYWRVQVSDKKGKRSGWSKTAKFTTALTDWGNAKWIGYEELPDSMIQVPGVHSGEDKTSNKAKQRPVIPLFRKSFNSKNKVRSAFIFISGLGQYELTINGKKAGDNFLAPGWTFYDKRVLYNSYDITNLIKNGENAIGVIVGNGFHNINRERYRKLTVAFGMPKMICKLIITYTDGSSNTIVSDNSWKTAPSPITFTSIYGGEDYDANLEQQGWDQPAFDDTKWKHVLLVKDPKGKLEAEKDYPVKVMEVLPHQSVSEPVDSVRMYDFGQNASGIIELKVKGHKGQVLKLTPAELLTDDKLANQKATGRSYYYTYTLKGEEEEIWRPKFTYYGFRYVQVEGAESDQLVEVKLLHTRNSTLYTGTFVCSNPLFNKIHELIRWAIKSNIQSVVTDCPHREKLSWLEQDYLMGTSVQYNFDIYQLYKKLVNDMIDAQTAEGLVPDIAPEFVFFNDHGFGFRDSPEWGSAAVILPWLIYKWYGDKTVMRTAYPMMKRYVEYLQSRAEGNVLTYGLGDWYDYVPLRPGVAQLTPKSLTATAIYYYDVKLLSEMAALMENHTDEANLKTLAADIKKTFNQQFFNDTTKVYATGSQTSMAMPLCVGLVETVNRKAVFNNLVDSIRHDGKKLTAGDIGFHFLVQALQENGASQLLFEMNNRSDVPGYGFQLAKGATALTESWQALTEVSNNHLMLGHLMEWLYNGLGGINQAEGSVGYKDIVIRPEVVGDISFVKASYNSIYGTIRSEWKKQADHFLLEVEIPANTTATVYLPATKEQTITEGNKQIKVSGYKDGKAIIKVGSGIYYFRVQGEALQ